MIDILRAIGSILFGLRWVVLVDHDGERSVRRIRFYGGKPAARRFPHLNETDVWLEDGGSAEGVIYVHSWEPYDPFAPKRFPTYSGSGWK